MGGEISLGNVNHISIIKFEEDYQLTFLTDQGRFHITQIKNLEQLLINALKTVENWEVTRLQIKLLEETENE